MAYHATLPPPLILCLCFLNCILCSLFETRSSLSMMPAEASVGKRAQMLNNVKRGFELEWERKHTIVAVVCCRSTVLLILHNVVEFCYWLVIIILCYKVPLRPPFCDLDNDSSLYANAVSLVPKPLEFNVQYFCVHLATLLPVTTGFPPIMKSPRKFDSAWNGWNEWGE